MTKVIFIGNNIYIYIYISITLQVFCEFINYRLKKAYFRVRGSPTIWTSLMWVLCMMFHAPSYPIEALTHESTNSFHSLKKTCKWHFASSVMSSLSFIVSFSLEHQWKIQLEVPHVKLNSSVKSSTHSIKLNISLLKHQRKIQLVIYRVRKVDQILRYSTTGILGNS